MEKHLKEHEEQRTEELSSHGPAPAQSLSDRENHAEELARPAINVETRSISLPVNIEVAHKIHRAALLAASIEIEPYAVANWEVQQESKEGYEARLVLEPTTDPEHLSIVEVRLSNLFISDGSDATKVESSFSFADAVSPANKLARDVVNKTQTVFETALK